MPHNCSLVYTPFKGEAEVEKHSRYLLHALHQLSTPSREGNPPWSPQLGSLGKHWHI